jgi:hypothetical protein
MGPNHPDEKREYVRVAFSTHAHIRRLSASAVERMRSSKKAIRAIRDGHTPQTQGATWMPDPLFLSNLAEYLSEIDEKLDKILQILERDAAAPDQVGLKVFETLDISGSGVRMVVDGSVSVGELLHVSLRIPDFPLGLFRVCGEVVHTSGDRGETENRFKVGIKFLDLSEEERETLIAFTFRQQRERIRQMKDA